eukprot:GHVR01147980.1.p1 GENE.GHVR01147980.1~~GHVR01147980.1.p1  ORF type:complete len:356 (+),score=147.87 GHVR01147980.1:139-1068(+)
MLYCVCKVLYISVSTIKIFINISTHDNNRNTHTHTHTSYSSYEETDQSENISNKNVSPNGSSSSSFSSTRRECISPSVSPSICPSTCRVISYQSPCYRKYRNLVLLLKIENFNFSALSSYNKKKETIHYIISFSYLSLSYKLKGLSARTTECTKNSFPFKLRLYNKKKTLCPILSIPASSKLVVIMDTCVWNGKSNINTILWSVECLHMHVCVNILSEFIGIGWQIAAETRERWMDEIEKKDVYPDSNKYSTQNITQNNITQNNTQNNAHIELTNEKNDSHIHTFNTHTHTHTHTPTHTQTHTPTHTYK